MRFAGKVEAAGAANLAIAASPSKPKPAWGRSPSAVQPLCYLVATINRAFFSSARSELDPAQTFSNCP